MADLLDALFNGDDIPAPEPPIMTIEVDEGVIANAVSEYNFYTRLAKLCEESAQEDNARRNREIACGILCGLKAVSYELFREVNDRIDEPTDVGSW